MPPKSGNYSTKIPTKTSPKGFTGSCTIDVFVIIFFLFFGIVAFHSGMLRDEEQKSRGWISKNQYNPYDEYQPSFVGCVELNYAVKTICLHNITHASWNFYDREHHKIKPSELLNFISYEMFTLSAYVPGGTLKFVINSSDSSNLIKAYPYFCLYNSGNGYPSVKLFNEIETMC
jgi:hypothetical protein